MKKESKIPMPITGGINTLVNPRAKSGLVSSKNWFPYEVGSLEKRKGIRYLKTVDGVWETSETPIRQETVGDSGITVPYSNIGIRSVKTLQFFRDSSNNDILLMVADQVVPSFSDTTFTAVEGDADASSGFTSGNTYTLALFYKTAAGLVYINEAEVAALSATAKIDITIGDIPDNVQYAVIAVEDSTPTRHRPVYIMVSGDTTASLTSNDNVTLDSDNFADIYPNATDANRDGENDLYFDTTIGNGSTLYAWHPDWDTPRQVFNENTAGDLQFSSYMPGVRARVPNANTQSEFVIREIFGYLYIPTINGLNLGSATGWPSGEDVSTDHIGVWIRINTSQDTTTILRSNFILKTGVVAGEAAPPRASKLTYYKDRIICSGNPYKKEKVYHSMPFAGGALGLGVVNFNVANQTLLLTNDDEADPTITALSTYTRSTAISDITELLAVFKSRSFYLLSGDWDDTDPTNNTISSNKMSSIIGCERNSNITSTKLGTIFASRDGIYAINPSGEPVSLSEPIRPLVNSQKPTSIVYYDGIIKFSKESTRTTIDVLNNDDESIALVLGIPYLILGNLNFSNTNRGYLYYTIEQTAGTTSFKLYKSTSATSTYLVASGTRSGDGIIYLSEENNSNIYGSVSITYNENKTEIAKNIISCAYTKRYELTLDIRQEPYLWYGQDEIFYLDETTYCNIHFYPEALISYDSESTYNNIFSAFGPNPVVYDKGYNYMGNQISSLLLSNDITAQDPSLYKVFTHLGITAQTDFSTSLYAHIITGDGDSDLDIFRTLRNSPLGEYDVESWDSSYWYDDVYEHKKIMFSRRPMSKSARIAIIHNEKDKNIKITDLELFLKLKRRSMT